MRNLGYDITTSTPEEMAQTLRNEIRALGADRARFRRQGGLGQSAGGIPAAFTTCAYCAISA